MRNFRTNQSRSCNRQRLNGRAKDYTMRALLVWGILVLGTLALAARLFYLQIIDPVITYKQAPDGKSLTQIARDQQTTKLDVYIPRRQIVDRANNVLATDRLTYTLYVHPYLFKRNSTDVPAKEIARELAVILERNPEELEKIFSQQKWGIRLAENLPEAAKTKIAALQIDGLDLRQQYSRFYPHQEMAAEVTGYVNRDSVRSPQAGIELTQQHLLERPSVRWKMKRSYSNNELVFHPGELKRSQKLFNFDDLRLQLTIDLRIQQMARHALKQQMEKYQAKRGAVIVMNVRDGAIAALVSEPTYDPNKYFENSDFGLFKNWAITDLYEPGSTFKPINLALALDAKVITPQDTVEDTGKIKIKDATVSNHDFATKGARGELTLAEILQYSSNVGMIKIMNRLDPAKYYRLLQKLGIEESLEFDIPGYTPGRLKDEVEFAVRAIEPATAAFGQGFSLTPLKLIQLHAALANRGKLVNPHVVRGLADYNGFLHYSLPTSSKPIFTPQTSSSVLKMMERVVEEGSGVASKIPGYRIAGKTGTSQKANTEGGYDEDAKITSFVATFPVKSPRYAILAVVDEPHGEHTYGSTVAAPIVGSVIESIINIEGIPPTKVDKTSSE